MPDQSRDQSLTALRQQTGTDEPGAIEFALMLDRAIEAFRDDPELLRSAVYELARTKLRDQLAHTNPGHKSEAMRSLELAIDKVEAFSKAQPALLIGPHTSGAALPPPTTAAPTAFARPTSTRRRWVGYLLALLIAGGAIGAILAGRNYFENGSSKSRVTEIPPPVVAPASPPAPVVKKRPMPSTYGSFAVVGEEFVELQPVGISAPDIRVAVSSQIRLPDRAALETTKPSFMIFERLPPAVSRAEARVMARIKRTGGDPSEPTAWVIRNTSTPLRVMMDPDRTDILMISPNADVELKPGRYALVVGSKAFDFTIAGTPDPAVHCLEQVVATNGNFYAPCR